MTMEPNSVHTFHFFLFIYFVCLLDLWKLSAFGSGNVAIGIAVHIYTY